MTITTNDILQLINTDDTIQHFGVKGMKWGVRKDRPKSTNRINAESNLAARKKDAKDANSKLLKETNYGLGVASKETQRNLKLANLEVKYARQDISSAKILDKLNSKPKSKQQLAQEEKYKGKGLTDDEAAIEAYKNIKVKQAITIGAATAITAGGVIAGYKISEEHFDKVIKSGSSLQNITSESDMGIRDAFYSSKNSLDRMKYKGLYGKHLLDSDGKAFSKEIKALTDIKRASPKNARKALEELMNSDPDFAKGVKDYMKPDNIEKRLPGIYKDKVSKSLNDLGEGKITKDLYETFNAALVDHSPEMQPLTDKYYKSLSKKGYNALKDVNDSKYSGYGAINPIIAFNTKGKVSVVDVKELAKEEIAKHHGKSMAMIHVKPIATGLLPQPTAAALGVLGVKKYNKRRLDKAAEKYMQDNPNSKMTRTEVRRMLERSRVK